MKKYHLICAILLVVVLSHAEQKEYSWYVGVNPVAVPSALQLTEDVKRYIPMISGNEYGLALSGGFVVNSSLATEARLSFGHSNQFAAVGQLHVGANYFFSRRQKGFYAGGYIKSWDYYNRLTKIHFMNIAPYAAIGYWFDLSPLYVDLRLNQTIAALSWSTLAHTSAGADWFFSPWPAFMPVMPSLTISVGWQIQ